MTAPVAYDIATPKEGNAKQIAALVNDVYDVAEKEFWIEGHKRTDSEQIGRLIEQGKIMTASIDGKIIGVVQVRKFDEHIGWFGMLATDRNHRGKGIGLGLLHRAEALMKNLGCTTMQCEVLVPETGMIEEKEILAGWYKRNGYRLISSGNFEKLYPKAVPDLKMSCKLDLYLKEL